MEPDLKSSIASGVIFTVLIFILMTSFLFIPSMAQDDDGGGQQADWVEFWTDGPGDANNSFNEDGTGTYLGLTSTEYFKLWGYDEDEQGSVSSGGEIDTNYSGDINASDPGEVNNPSRMNLSELTGYYRVMDATYRRPPETASQWNRRSSDGLQQRLNGQIQNSVFPRDASINRKSSGRLEGAYITFYSITPSTTVHYRNSSTITYMRESGQVITAADYLVKSLDTDVNGDTKFTYNLQANGVDWIRLKTKDNCGDGEPCELKKVNTGRQSKVIDYSNLQDHLNESESNTLYLEARIYADIQVTRYTWDPCGENETDCGWQQQNQWTETDDVTVQDSREIAFQDLNVSVHAATVDSRTTDSTVLHIENKGSNVSSYWGHANPNGEGIVRTNWKYYTARDKSWDFFLRQKRNGNVDSVRTKYRPVNVHAYPSTEGSLAMDESWNRTAEAEILDELGSNISTPNQPDDTMLDWIQQGNYTPANEVVVEFENGSVNPTGNFPVYGLVEGSSISVEPDEVHELRQVDLEFNVMNVLNTTAARVEVIARDAKTGEPINTSGTGDSIKIAGQTYQTNNNGRVETVIVKEESEGVVAAKYEAQAWWETETEGPAYKDEIRKVDIFRDGLMGIVNFIVFLLKLVIILLTPVWLAHIAGISMGMDIWGIIKDIARRNNPFS